MTPTRVPSLVLTALLAALAAWLLADGRLLPGVTYGDLPRVPVAAPLALVLLAVVELGMARVVRDRLRRRRDARGRPLGRALHPMQVARAAVLAKASSPAGALLLGAYAGLLVWLVPSSVTGERVVTAVAAGAALALVVAALVLERACRTPDEPRAQDLGSAA